MNLEEKMDELTEKVNSLDKNMYVLSDTSRRTLDIISDIQVRLRVLENDKAVHEGESKVISNITGKWLSIILSILLAISLGLHQYITELLSYLK